MADRQFITFYLDRDLFGLDILLVREINRNLEITPVELAPPYVRGLLNLRGQIVNVIDLSVRLGLPVSGITRDSSCIVVKTTGELDRSPSAQKLMETTGSDLVGLLVDRVGEVVRVDSAEVEPPPRHASGVSERYLNGVVKLNEKLLVTVNAGEILKAEEVAGALPSPV